MESERIGGMNMLRQAVRYIALSIVLGLMVSALGMFLLWFSVDRHPRKHLTGALSLLHQIALLILAPSTPHINPPVLGIALFYSGVALLFLAGIGLYRNFRATQV
jgi:hypothetical protein